VLPDDLSGRTAGEDTPNRILDEAQALFSERGYVGTTVQQVADRLGMTKAALYYHFPQGKAEIFVELMRRHVRRLHQGLARAVEAGETARERLGELREHDSEFVTWVFLNAACGVAGGCAAARPLPIEMPRALVALLLDGVGARRN
jgi:AcrR family transcriptional regulator